MTNPSNALRLTQYAAGGGCACKLPAADLDSLVSRLASIQPGDAEVGLEHGDDAAVLVSPPEELIVMTTDFFTPVVDDPYEFGQIAAANAMSDVYAMGGRPVAALNLLCWPAELPLETAALVLEGGASKCKEAGALLGGGHSISDKEPKYGLAVVGAVRRGEVMRIDAANAGLPLTLTKPLGVGVLNNRHKVTGERFDDAIASMLTLNRDAAAAAVSAGTRAATDVTGFGLLGHLFKMLRASKVSAEINMDAVPRLPDTLPSIQQGFVPGGTRRNLEWVRDQLASSRSEDDLLLLADAQTSGGLLIAGEVPGYPVIGRLVEGEGATITVT